MPPKLFRVSSQFKSVLLLDRLPGILAAMIPVIDVFAGAGGLGEGFASFQQPSGNHPFKVALSIEKDPWAHQTLTLRSFCRQFTTKRVPDDYYALLRGEISWQALKKRHAKEAATAERESWAAELGKISRRQVNKRIKEALGGSDGWVLIGGPPCQAYSLVGRARRKSIKDYRPEKDDRNTLYRHYLQIIADHWPTIFIMENVRGILSHKYLNRPIFDKILRDLRCPSNAVGGRRKTRYHYRIVSLVSPSLEDSAAPVDYIVQCEKYGIPQKRHRVILVGIRDDLGDVLPRQLTESTPIPCSQVLQGLPALRSGLSREKDSAQAWLSVLRKTVQQKWFRAVSDVAGKAVALRMAEIAECISVPAAGRGAAYIAVPASCSYQSEWFVDTALGGVCGHETRGHIREDLYRYLFCACFASIKLESPKLDSFPAGLLPDHANIDQEDFDSTPFTDRFRVQVADAPATTVTSHISKDGHYYIHPDPLQCRSMTVREAARLQTFPDNYHFLGSRTSQYSQIGNAVPPLLARQIAERVAEMLAL